MKFSYITCWLIGLVTMFFSQLAEQLEQPYHLLMILVIYTLGLGLVWHIMYLDSVPFEDEDEVKDKRGK